MIRKEKMKMMDINQAKLKLLSVRGNVNAIKKRLRYLKSAARASGKMHEWRANEIQEIVTAWLTSVDKELAKLNKKLLAESGKCQAAT